jgi:hypothetical protein
MSFNLISGPNVPTIDLENSDASPALVNHITNLVENIDDHFSAGDTSPLQGEVLLPCTPTPIQKSLIPYSLFIKIFPHRPLPNQLLFMCSVPYSTAPSAGTLGKTFAPSSQEHCTSEKGKLYPSYTLYRAWENFLNSSRRTHLSLSSSFSLFCTSTLLHVLIANVIP